jgi:RND family efflux transporter MFP subunit
MAIETDPTTTASDSVPNAAPGIGTPQSASARERLATLFPDPSAPAPPWWRKRRRVIVAVVVLAVVASLVLAAQAFAASDPGYRTATVAPHDVDALLNAVATIEPVSQAAVAFPAAGTVATVDVKVGDSVAVGQALASLDPEKLTQTLHEKQAAEAQAELNLQRALSGESVSGGGNTPSNGVRVTAATMPSASDAALAAAQQAVLDAQHQVDAALNVATTALDSATTICAAAGVGATPPTTPTSAELAACQTATQAVLDAQTAVSTAQHQLATASTALDTLLAQMAASTNDNSSNGRTGNGSTGSGNFDGVGGSNASTPAASSPSAADLISYQKAVDAAAAQVAVAEQAIAQATIVSPIAGTVQAVTLAAGDTVDAASDTASIVVVGAGGFEATTTVSVDTITKVKVGQAATVLPDGSKRPLAGTVSSISITPDSSASSTSYRVTIGLTDPNAALDNGSTASLAIVTKSSNAALAVPTSAITTIGSRHTVTVLDGSTTKLVPVEIGVLGATWTEITSGVSAGAHVVLADIGEPLPGKATATSNGNSSTTRGNFPGGGNLPGGFRNGGPQFRVGGG